MKRKSPHWYALRYTNLPIENSIVLATLFTTFLRRQDEPESIVFNGEFAKRIVIVLNLSLLGKVFVCKMSQDDAKMSQDDAKMSQDDVRMSQDDVRMSQEGAKMSQDESR